MTQEEMKQKVDSGEWIEEQIQTPNTLSLEKNINKFKYFKIVTERSHTESDGQSVNIIKTPCCSAFYNRDYINKWTVECTCVTDGTYKMVGNFGDGFQINVTEKVIEGEDTSFYVKEVYGYRPTRKTIFVYKADPNTYLTTKTDEFLYTANDEKIATADAII